jgi:fluoroquinolone transport system permease protein
MHAIQIVRALGPIDARSISRDPLLRWLIALPIAVALGARLVFPLVLARLGEIIKLDLVSYYPVIAGAALLLITPVMGGQVIGFLLLDQRDDRTLTALQVTPLPMTAYLAYRLAAPVLAGLLLTPVALAIAGLADIGIVPLLVVSALASLLAPLTALFLASFAQNKVQGFALMKASSILLGAPLVAYFIPSDWQLAFGILPTYWPARLYWAFQSGDPNYWFYLVGGLAYQLLLLAALLIRFNRVIRM